MVVSGWDERARWRRTATMHRPQDKRRAGKAQAESNRQKLTRLTSEGITMRVILGTATDDEKTALAEVVVVSRRVASCIASSARGPRRRPRRRSVIAFVRVVRSRRRGSPTCATWSTKARRCRPRAW